MSDYTQAEPLLAGFPAQNVLADKSYDSQKIVDTVEKSGAKAVKRRAMINLNKETLLHLGDITGSRSVEVPRFFKRNNDMDNAILIVGASKGLGKELKEIYSSRSTSSVVSVGRSEKPTMESGYYIQADITTEEGITLLSDRLQMMGLRFETVIYCVSLWGESGELRSSELTAFLSAGPLGFLRIIEILVYGQLLTEQPLIVSIGSTATLNGNSVTERQKNPAYTLAKELQRSISLELQHKFSANDIRITTLTVGGLGGLGRIPAVDIAHMIDCINSISSASRPIEIIMPSISDYGS